MKRENDMTPKVELPRAIDAQYITGKEYRDNSRKNEKMEPKQNNTQFVDVTVNRSKVRCCKEQYWIGMLGP